MNVINFIGSTESKTKRRTLSKLLKMYQFNCTHMKIGIYTLPEVTNVHKYVTFDPDQTVRMEVMDAIKVLREDGYKVIVDVCINL